MSSILILAAHSHGENNVARAVAHALAERFGGHIHEAQAQVRQKWLRRALLQILKVPRFKQSIRKLGLAHPIFGLLNHDLPPLADAQFVITTRDRLVPVSTLISTALDAETVHIGELRKEWRHLPGFHVSRPGLPTGRNGIVLDILPTRIRLQRRKLLQNQLIGTVLIGGSNNIYCYTRQDWRDLSNAIHHISALAEIRWLVSTSPRTGAEGERILRECFTSLSTIDEIWYGDQPRDAVPDFLSQSDFSIVTEESYSMVSDGVAAGLPTIAMRPDAYSPRKAQNDFLNNLAEKKRIVRLSFNQISALTTLPIDDCKPMKTCWSKQFAAHAESIVLSRCRA